MAKLISKIYGDALFDAVCEDGDIDCVLEDARLVARTIEGSPELVGMLNNPKLSREAKAQAVQDVFSESVSNDMQGLLHVMIMKQRHNDIKAALEYFAEKVREYKNTGRAYVTTSMPMSDEQKEAVRTKLIKSSKYDDFEIEYNVDASIIGGIIIRIGDRIYDSSIKNKLNNLTRQLKSGSGI